MAAKRQRKASLEASAITETEKWWRFFNQGRFLLEREMFRNILFYLGYQWLYFDINQRQFRMAEPKSWVPKPVTNRFAPTIDVIRSAIINAEPKFLVEPATTSDKAITAARVANDFIEVLRSDSMFRKAKRELASWLVLTGTCGLGTEFSTSPEYGSVAMPGEKCVQCGLSVPAGSLPDDNTCPQCGGQGWLEDTSSMTEVPRGRLITTAWSPFEMYVDQATPDLESQPAVILARSYHVETARRYWKDSIEPIEPETSAPLVSSYLASVMGTVPGFKTGGYVDQRVQMKRLLLPPNDQYPDGIYAVITGRGKPVEVMEYPHVMEHSGRPYYPLTRAVYSQVPQRFWGKTPANDLAQKQSQRNRFESLLEMIVMTMASPVWIIPTGSNPSKITGHPGIQVTATPVSGMLPNRIQGVGPDASIVQYIEKMDQDFEEIANTFAVLKGKNPGQGLRAASALRMLEERGYGAFGSVFENLEEMYEGWAMIALEQFRKNADYPLVKLVMNTYGRWASQQFANVDLQPEISLRVEANSVRPKSSSAKMDTIQRLVAMGAINTSYPEQRLRVLEESGMLGLIPGVDADKEQAMRENAQFLSWAKGMGEQIQQALDPQHALEMMQQGGPPIEVNVLVDEHIQHFIQHRRFATSEEYKMLPEQCRKWFETMHMAAHLDAYKNLQMAGGTPGGLSPIPFGAMMPQAGGAPAGGPPPKAANGGL